MKPEETSAAQRGVLLDKPSILLPETSPLSSFAFYAVLLLLGGVGSMGSFFTAFEIPLKLWPLLLTALSCALVCTAQFRLPKWGCWLGLAAAAAWVCAVWWNFSDLTEAFMRVVNVVSAAYSKRLNFALPIFLYLETIFPDREAYLFQLFATLIQFPIFWLLSWLLVRRGRLLGPFCLTGLLLLIPLSFSILPAVWALGAVGLFWLFLLLSSPTLHHRRLLSRSHKRYQAAGVGFIRASSLALLPGLLLCMVLVYRLCPLDTYRRPKAVNNLRNSIASGVNLPAVFHDGSGGGGGSRVDLSSLGDRRYTGETALRVRRTWQEPAPSEDDLLSVMNGKKEYLKSFVGSVYTGTSWDQLSQEDKKSAAEALGNRKAQTFPADLSQTLPASGLDAAYPCELQVETVGASAVPAYAPYGLSAQNGLPGGITWKDDCALASSQLFGTKRAAYSAVSLPKEDFFSYYTTRMLSWQGTEGEIYYKQEGDAVFSAVVTLHNKLSMGFTGDADTDGEAQLDLSRLDEDTLEQFTFQQRELALSLERYNAFVYDTYTRLPDRLRDFLDGYTAERELIKTPETNRQSYLENVRRVLSEECSYTLSPQRLPSGKDFVEHFLAESKEGYCVHFATAATALLRYAGIPARYAEGYVAPVRDGEWVNVPDRNAHAWVEVWYGGSGWVPFEVTPAGPDAPAAYEDATVPVDEMLQPTFTPVPMGSSPTPAGAQQTSPTPTPTPSPAPTAAPGTLPGNADPSAQEDGRLPGWAAALLAVLGVVLLILALRLLRLYLRKRSFTQPDRNKAALAVYAHLLRLQKTARSYSSRIGLPPDGPSMEELEQLALKARFSSHTLTEEELSRMTGAARSLEDALRRFLRPLPRLWQQFFRVLF